MIAQVPVRVVANAASVVMTVKKRRTHSWSALYSSTAYLKS
jgi:hypothetical protein